MKWEQVFFDSLKERKVKITAEPYDRPEARGHVMALRLTPELPLKGRIVFAHATGNDGIFPQVELFYRWLAEGYEVFTFDLDGHGRQSTTQLSPEGALSMVFSAYQKAITSDPALAVHGVGQSLGAALWLRALADAPIKLASLVLFSAPIYVDLSPKALAHEFYGLISQDFWRQRRFYGIPLVVPPMGSWRRQDYPIRFSTPSKAPYPTRIRDLIQQLQVEKAASQVHIPVLLINGSKDYIVHAIQGERLREALHRGSSLIIQGATHYTVTLSLSAASKSLEHFESHG